MNKWCIIACLVLFACTKESERELFMQAHFIAGKPLKNVKLYWVEEEELREISGTGPITMSLISEDGAIQTLQQIDGSFQMTTGSIAENTTYRLRATVSGRQVEAIIAVPLRPVIAQTSPQQFFALPMAPLDVVYSCAWAAVPDQNYLLQLQELLPGALIPQTPYGGAFKDNFSGPYQASGLQLTTNDFKVYGSHLLRISAISSSYVDAFFNQLSNYTGQIREGPGNVKGGKGLVTASAETEVLLDVQ